MDSTADDPDGAEVQAFAEGCAGLLSDLEAETPE
jgi:hypothetical protein